MAHFFGTLKGGGQMVTRCGNVNSGIYISAQSHTGKVSVNITSTSEGDWLNIRWESYAKDVSPNYGTLYHGPLDNLDPSILLGMEFAELVRKNRKKKAQYGLTGVSK